jgi:DUF4097 and DUF4098 domain-containing protein YvlB
MGKALKLLSGLLLLLTGCGNDVNVGGGANFPWPWPVDANVFVQKAFSEEVPIVAHLGLRLEAVNGEVEVTGQPGATSIKVTATLRVGADTLPDAQAGLALLEVQVTDAPGEVLVQTVQPSNPQGRQYIVNYTITLPPDLAADVSQANGHVTVEGVESPVGVDQGNGTVLLSAVVGDASVQLANGTIDASITLPPGGEIRLTTANGTIDLRIPTSTSAALSAMASTGTITWTNLTISGAVYTGSSLTGTLGGGAGIIDLKTGNGNIDLTGFAP